jgi:penicillin-binding protein 1C
MWTWIKRGDRNPRPISGVDLQVVIPAEATARERSCGEPGPRAAGAVAGRDSGSRVSPHGGSPGMTSEGFAGARRRLLAKRSSSLRLATGCAVLAVIASVGALGLYRQTLAEIGPLSLDAAKSQSVTVVDREDRLLRAFTTKDGRWRLPLDPKDVDPHYLKLLLTFEDRRFYEHGGVDPRAIVRAVTQAATHGRLVSGGSTLTMQVARLLEGKHERTARGKLRQMLRARQLERALTKTEILRLYLRLAPFGGNLEGVRAASLAYFGKEPRRLSMSEAALLVALPQSPEARRLDRHPKAAERARNRVLDTAVKAGAISKREADKAKAERVPLARVAFPMLAPHLAESEVACDASREVHKLTLDRSLQMRLEGLAKRRSSSPITRRGRSSPTSPRRTISMQTGKARSIWRTRSARRDRR